MRATISAAGLVRREAKRLPDRTTTAEDVKDPEKLARALQALHVASVSTAERRELVFEDQAVGSGGALVRLPHNFGGRVYWSVRDWQSTAGGVAPVLERDDATTDDELVLASAVAGTATIRIEAA